MKILISFYSNLRGNCNVVARCCRMNLHVASSSIDNGECHYEEAGINRSFIPSKSVSCGPISLRSFVWSRNLSSQVGQKSTDKEDDLEDGFSDLEEPPESAEVNDGSDKEDKELMSEGELSEESDEAADNSLGLLDVESTSSEVKGPRRRTLYSPLFKTIMDSPRQSLTSALNKWAEEGKPLGREEISSAMLNLRKRRLYVTALQVMLFLCKYCRLLCTCVNEIYKIW